MTEATLRAGCADDALCIGALGTQVFLDTYCTEGLRPDLAREALGVHHPDQYRARLQQADRHFILIEQAAFLIGFAELKAPATSPGGFVGAELVRLYLIRHFQAQGFGARLLRAAEEWAARSGGLWLTAWSGNTKALGFYAAQGYQDAGLSHYEIEGQRHENRVLCKAFGARGQGCLAA